jgi:transcriptional regulator with XRE-family HTH domain
MKRYLEEYRGLNTAIGQLIRRIRNLRGISQMKLASDINVSYQQIQKYEKGSSQLTVARLKQIADSFGVSLQTFIETGPESVGDDLRLSRNEIRLIKIFRRLSNHQQKDRFVRISDKMVSLINEE